MCFFQPGDMALHFNSRVRMRRSWVRRPFSANLNVVMSVLDRRFICFRCEARCHFIPPKLTIFSLL